MENAVDVNNAPEPALADGLAPSGAALTPSPRVRWRQRAVVRGRSTPAGAPDTPPVRATHAPSSQQTTQVAQPAPDAPSSSNDGARSPTAAAGHTSNGDPAASNALAFAACASANANANANASGADSDSDSDSDTDTEASASASASASAGAGADADVVNDDEDADGNAAPRNASAAAAAPTQDTDAPQRAPRDLELWLLARRAQGAALRLDFELRTALARQVFRRDFVYVSRQLHALEASRRVQGLDRSRLDDALATLRQRGDVIEAFMDQRTAELQAAIDARGPASARIAFARPAHFQATIVSPGAHRFLALLLRADDLLARLEMAWLLGLVEPAARSTLVSDCRRALLGFKDLACGQRRAVGLLVQEVNAQRGPGAKA